MGDKTGIAWTDATWNPVMSLDRLDQPLRWRKPRRVFVNSMSELFYDDVPVEFIAQVFAVMALAPHHTFQILTKRPERMRGILFNLVFIEAFRVAVAQMAGDEDASWRALREWPLPNVWIGVSVEDQATADERIPLLLETPAALRFLSYEPALEGIDFSKHIHLIDWIIVGGESGPRARPFDVNWASDTIAQCRAVGVPVFVKQLGAQPRRDTLAFGPNRPIRLTHRAGADIDEWPADLRVQEWPEVA